MKRFILVQSIVLLLSLIVVGFAPSTLELVVTATPVPLTLNPMEKKQIAFHSNRSGNWDIWVIDSDKNLRQLTTDLGTDAFPAWSPDGRVVAFGSNRSGNWDIWIMDADGKNQRQLTTDPARDHYPDWSPDGHFITFQSDRRGNNNIWVMDSDGKNLRQLTTDPATDEGPPMWSTDSTRIVFWSDRSGNYDIWVMDSDGKNQRQLTTDPARDVRPDWSPDDRAITFHSKRTGNWDIWVMESNGKNLRQLTTDPADDVNPAWSPDGSFVAFESMRSGNWDIWVVDPDKKLSQLTTDPAHDRGPAWSSMVEAIGLHPPSKEPTAPTPVSERRVAVDFIDTVTNNGPKALASLEFYLSIPKDEANQEILDVRIEPEPSEYLMDQWGQRIAYLAFTNVEVGQSVQMTMTIEAKLREVRYAIDPVKVGSLEDIPSDILADYLVDGDEYKIHDPTIQRASKEAVGDDTNPYRVAMRIYDYVIDHMRYEEAGGWDDAPTVLERGTGSCSEYTFLLVALCRASGLPARFAAGTIRKGVGTYTDRVFHRWAEVYLPNYGWIPVDPTLGDAQATGRDRQFYFAAIEDNMLIMTVGGGGSKYLFHGYRSWHRWKPSKGQNVKTDRVAKWY